MARTISSGSRSLSRRRAIQIGGLGVAGLALPRLLAAEASRSAGSPAPRADACILIFLNGGPSHLDMWDMKPAAPEGIRGEFAPIASSLPGVQVCEHLPRLAAQMHRAMLIRSLHHTVNNSHAEAVYTSITGHDRGDGKTITGTSSRDHPTPGATLAKLRPPGRDAVSHVALPYITKEGAKGPPQPGFFGGLLGRAYDPLFILKDPNAADFSVPELTLLDGVSADRLTHRRQLLDRLDERFVGQSAERAYDDMDGFQRRAFDLLVSPKARKALDIAAEPDGVRTSYGRNIYGQSVLLARRLIEAGTRLVTISWAPDANATWDTHTKNFEKLKTTLLLEFDAAYSSLLADLVERGMLERTVVAVFGDFGRSPRVNKAAGRDHWNYCYSALLAGGGFEAGKVHGASDPTGAFPALDPLGPGDLIATMYHALGVAPDTLLTDAFGRPHRLVPVGEVVPGLLA
jgi:hypothetical protein